MSVASVALPRVISRTRAADFFLLATFFSVTFEKVHWNVAGALGIADVLTVLFLAAFVLTSRGPLPRTAAIVLGFFAAFLIIYLLGYFNLQTKQGLDQFTKGMVKFVLHFLFLIVGVTYLARRGRRFYWRTLGWFTAGLVANCLYGILQLLAARAGHNLDRTVLSPLTGGASSINIYGSVNGASVYRPNALTGDPNHLGVMLVVPLLALTPLYLRMQRGQRLKWQLGIALAVMLLTLLATLSRSGALGLIAGLLVLAIPYRRFVWSRALLAPLGALAVLLAYVLYSRWHFFSVVLRSRIQTGSSSTSAHYELGPALVLRGAHRRNGARWGAAFLRLPALRVPAPACGPRARAGAGRGRRSERAPCASARVGLHGRARRDDRVELLLPDDAVLLFLRLRGARARIAGRVREAPLKRRR